MEHRAPSRPSISTPELRDRIMELLSDGVPLAVIGRSGLAHQRGRSYPCLCTGGLFAFSIVRGKRQDACSLLSPLNFVGKLYTFET